MKTYKPVSSVSFNTAAYLTSFLDNLVQTHVISFYCFITHQPENLDQNDHKKQHIHLYIEPSSTIDLDLLRDQISQEIDPQNPLKPLGCLPFQRSKFIDWYYYAIHDFNYLMKKGIVKEFHYTRDDIITNNPDYLTEKLNDTQQYTPAQFIAQAIRQGYTFTDLLVSGSIPVNQISNYEKLFNYIEPREHFLMRKNVEKSDNVPPFSLGGPGGVDGSSNK